MRRAPVGQYFTAACTFARSASGGSGCSSSTVCPPFGTPNTSGASPPHAGWAWQGGRSTVTRTRGASRLRRALPHLHYVRNGNEPTRPSAGRALERRHAFRHLVERLLVAGEDDHLRLSEHAR